MKATSNRKTLTGTVVSDKMDKTVVVRVDRKFMHPTFKKIVKRSKKVQAHDEKNECRAGDFISISETRPLSKNKRWRLVDIIKKAVPVEEAAAK